MNGRMGVGKPGGSDRRAAVGLALIGLLAVVQGLQAAALRDCPHHGGSGEHGAMHAVDAGTPMPHGAPDGMRVPEDTSPTMPADAPEAPTDPEPHGPCDCLGPCGASAALQPPAVPAESVFAEIAPRRIAGWDVRRPVPSPRTLPFVLPYSNAPPA